MALLVAGLAFAFAPASVVPAASAGDGFFRSNVFASPSRNIVCAYRGRAEQIECETINNKLGAIVDRYGRRGLGISYPGPGLANPYAVPVLGYGYAYTAPGLKCRMFTDGIRCFNQTGHGFFLSRDVRQLF